MANLKNIRRLSDELVAAQSVCYEEFGLKSAPIDGQRCEQCIEFCKGYIMARHRGVNIGELAMAGQMADEKNAHIASIAANRLYEELSANGEKAIP